ncbi:MAG: DUF4328 domain-containing protein [Pseudomonadota bacterium]
MEFAENGAVVKPDTTGVADTYDSNKSDRGYADGPRPTLGLFGAMRIGLSIYIGVEILWQMILAAYLVFPSRLPEFMFATAETDLNFVVLGSFLYLAATIIAFFFSCRFTYRAMRNLHTIHSPVAQISPGWSVGYYFIPFANLVMPANAMSQVYHGTYQAVGEQSRQASPIPIWWTCWLLSGVGESIADRSGMTGLTAFAFYVSSGLLGIAAAVSLWRMSARVAVRQEQFQIGGVAHVFD